MKAISKLMVAAAAFAATTPAQAALVTGQISIGGYAAPSGSGSFGTANGYDAVMGQGGAASPGTAGGITSYGAGSGSFAGLSCSSNAGGCGTIADILNFGTFSPITGFLTLATGVGGPTISFDLSSIYNSSANADPLTGGTLMFSGLGTINFSGYDATPGVFTFTAQGNQISSFSAAAISAPVPEPGTWALMLLGFGAVGYSLRRRRSVGTFLPQAA